MNRVERRAVSSVRIGFVLLLAGVFQLGSGLTSSALAVRISAPKPSGQWSMFMNGPMRMGRSPVLGPQTGHPAWQFSTQTNYGGPVIGRDGTIYQGTDLHQLLAFNPNGVLKWVIPTGRAVGSTPAILPDGRIVFVDESGTVYAANPDGSLSWTNPTGAGAGSSPAIGRDGTIYSTIGKTVYALHPDGSIRWTYQLVGYALGPVTVRPDGVVYAMDSNLYAIDPSGSLLWKSAGSQLGLANASVGPDQTIYVNAWLPTVYAFNPDGSIKWSYEASDCCGAAAAAAPAIGADGTIYAGENINNQGAMLALNPDGTLKWESDYGLAPTSPAIDRDGTIYYGGGSSAPNVYALNPDGSLKWEFDSTAGYLRTPVAIGAHHRLYAGSSQGFYAIGP